MTISERSRQNLFNRLDEQLGPEEAETMMELLPHQGWSDVARTGDIQALERSLNDRITAESALLRAEMAELRGELRNDMADLRGELRSDMSGLQLSLTEQFASFRDELHRDQRTLQRQIILALVVALISVVISAAGLG
ncbi:MAG: hypothetical protein KDB02_02840 [Acidimicrobiales bacterium]|nr:hypothetical protein [Acidimicrobiales bacterium]